MNRAAALLVAILLFVPLASAYTDYSLSVRVTVDKDGFAHVREKTIFYVDNQAEIDAFKDNLRLGKSTILEWKKFSDNIGYHIGGVQGAIDNLSITAGPEYSVSTNARSVTLDYDLVGQFVNSTPIGSRTVRYTLREELLGFERSEVRQTILGSNVNFTIELPPAAAIVTNDGVLSVGPLPYTYDAQSRSISWFGPMTGKWMLVYEIEEPLSTEVYGFFSDVYKTTIELIPLGLLLLTGGFVLTILLKMRRR